MNITPPNAPRTRSSVWLRIVNHCFRFVAYWFNLIMQPLIAVTFVLLLIYFFGYAQRNFDWFNDAETSEGEAQVGALYACSMLCVFLEAPGRCPVCGMELQVVEQTGDPKDIYGVTIDSTSRRLANIQTVPALNLPVSKRFESLGRIGYDETAESTISSYIDGRLERLIVDFEGATVRTGEPLAVVYSPDLYADQVGLLNAKKAFEETPATQKRMREINQKLYEGARRRLVEFGVPRSQIDLIESSGQANSRIQIVSPQSGTVVEKLVDEGKYVKTGTPLLRIADLKSVWLNLELFPEDSSNLKLGQAVSVQIQSRVGHTFAGTISFIDPIIDSKTQTVSVRVVIPNEAGLIKIGDFGKAVIESPLNETRNQVVVPREAVLINGQNSIAYVETKPGRFEFRKVVIAETLKEQVVISSGIKAGEMVVADGVFMVDSTFNIQGKVSLIDPERADRINQAKLADAKAEAEEIERSFAPLSPEDRMLAEAQVICPVSEVKLGTQNMGVPIKVDVIGTPIMICCEGCRKGLLANPEKHLRFLKNYQAAKAAQSEEDLPQMELPD